MIASDHVNITDAGVRQSESVVGDAAVLPVGVAELKETVAQPCPEVRTKPKKVSEQDWTRWQHLPPVPVESILFAGSSKRNQNYCIDGDRMASAIRHASLIWGDYTGPIRLRYSNYGLELVPSIDKGRGSRKQEMRTRSKKKAGVDLVGVETNPGPSGKTAVKRIVPVANGGKVIRMRGRPRKAKMNKFGQVVRKVATTGLKYIVNNAAPKILSSVPGIGGSLEKAYNVARSILSFTGVADGVSVQVGVGGAVRLVAAAKHPAGRFMAGTDLSAGAVLLKYAISVGPVGSRSREMAKLYERYRVTSLDLIITPSASMTSVGVLAYFLVPDVESKEIDSMTPAQVMATAPSRPCYKQINIRTDGNVRIPLPPNVYYIRALDGVERLTSPGTLYVIAISPMSAADLPVIEQKAHYEFIGASSRVSQDLSPTYNMPLLMASTATNAEIVYGSVIPTSPNADAATMDQWVATTVNGLYVATTEATLPLSTYYFPLGKGDSFTWRLFSPVYSPFVTANVGVYVGPRFKEVGINMLTQITGEVPRNVGGYEIIYIQDYVAAEDCGIYMIPFGTTAGQHTAPFLPEGAAIVNMATYTVVRDVTLDMPTGVTLLEQGSREERKNLYFNGNGRPSSVTMAEERIARFNSLASARKPVSAQDFRLVPSLSIQPDRQQTQAGREPQQGLRRKAQAQVELVGVEPNPGMTYGHPLPTQLPRVQPSPQKNVVATGQAWHNQCQPRQLCGPRSSELALVQARDKLRAGVDLVGVEPNPGPKGRSNKKKRQVARKQPKATPKQMHRSGADADKPVVKQKWVKRPMTTQPITAGLTPPDSVPSASGLELDSKHVAGSVQISCPLPSAPVCADAKGVCRSFAKTGKCKFGDKCKFSHGQAPAQKTVVKKVDRPCKEWTETGHCRYGNSCIFQHASRDATLKNLITVGTTGSSKVDDVVTSKLDGLAKSLDVVAMRLKVDASNDYDHAVRFGMGVYSSKPVFCNTSCCPRCKMPAKVGKDGLGRCTHCVGAPFNAINVPGGTSCVCPSCHQKCDHDEDGRGWCFRCFKGDFEPEIAPGQIGQCSVVGQIVSHEFTNIEPKRGLVAFIGSKLKQFGRGIKRFVTSAPFPDPAAVHTWSTQCVETEKAPVPSTGVKEDPSQESTILDVRQTSNLACKLRRPYDDQLTPYVVKTAYDAYSKCSSTVVRVHKVLAADLIARFGMVMPENSVFDAAYDVAIKALNVNTYAAPELRESTRCFVRDYTMSCVNSRKQAGLDFA